MGMTIGTSILDRTYERIAQGTIFEALEELARDLTRQRAETDSAIWRTFCREVVPAHQLWPVIQQAPFTSRAYQKPRGYPGDAVVLDWIYGYERLTSNPAPALRAIHQWEWQTPSCVSVRNRRAILAETMDRVAALSPQPIRVAAIACGHLREAAGSAAAHAGGVESLFALDQDASSLAVAQTMAPAVRPIHGSVRGILTGKVRLAEIDLVYSAGLYDYLGPSIATELTRRLFGMLRPGGTLLVANFNPSLRDIGYLEAYMDWQLVYRTDDELIGCFGAIPEADIESRRVFRDTAGNISFVEVTRAA